ncbi:MAG: hypothetical protein IE925_06750 [Rhodobacterales bacterium]|jgi:hypothetical protein|nr:hypothetical protein [Rhodobacterales bacterium]
MIPVMIGIGYIGMILVMSNDHPKGADFALMFGLVAWIPYIFFWMSLSAPFTFTTKRNGEKTSIGERFLRCFIGLIISAALFTGFYMGVDAIV